ncbi:MAG: anti-sigma factor [Rubrivivax sp.]
MTPAPDDLELHAWLDGELPPERSAQVETWLREHPEEAARVRLWAADGDALRARFDGVLDEAVPLALAQNVWRKAPASAPASAWRAGWTRWAAAFALFALGGLAGAALMWRAQGVADGVAGATEPGWVRRAAVAHAVYVPEVRHPVEVKAQEEHLSRWLTKRIDAPVKLFDLRSQGFELIGGRLLPDASGPSAQLMYQSLTESADPGGKPLRVTVYLRRPDDDTPAAFRYERQGDLGMFYWVEGRSAQGGACGYALVGALPRERLLALAEAIFRQGEPAPR